ncbi:MAG: DUF6517 family protein [Haloferacaceae archaeon]
MDGAFRARLPLAALVAALVVLAGCSAGGEVTTFEADAAEVSDDVVAETGYEYNGTEEQTIERTFEVAGSERNVTVINKVATYEKAVEVPGVGSQRLAAVAVVSSPSISLAGQEFNPIAEFTARDLASQLADRREGLTVERRVGQSGVSTLGTDATVSRFAGSQALGPTSLEVTVQVTKVKHEGDFVAVLAVHPSRLDDEATVRRMIRGLVHPA